MADYLSRYQGWLSHPDIDEKSKADLRAIKDDQKEIEDRFYQDLQFGTAGLRGVLGAGTNRMNFYTVARAADGFARYLVDKGDQALAAGVAISYDSRHFSPEFAELTARIFASYGAKVYLSNSLRPVPMLSYAVRLHNCACGVMITASHNPKQYNGFKAYGEDGGQLPPEDASLVSAKMAEKTDLAAILKAVPSLDAMLATGRLVYMGEDLDQSYTAMLLDLLINKEAIKKHHDLKIVYTPIHGSGNLPVRRVLKEAGFTNVIVVKEQEMPDPDFTTAPYPNPEARAALQMGIDLAEKENADLLIATDPDADRTGLAVRTNTGEFVVLTGNQIGLLLMDYILNAKSKAGSLEAKSFVVTTIVSSRLTRMIAQHYGVDLAVCLTGFKFIAEQILDRDENGDEHFQFGFEESFGYLAGTSVRDKDAVVASMLLAEMAADAATRNQTLYDSLEALYQKYAYAAETTVAIERAGKTGLDKIQAVNSYLRENEQEMIDLVGPKALNDYKLQQKQDYTSGVKSKLDLPSSDVMLYDLEGLDWFCVRPSGTEPKLKIYMGCYGKKAEAVKRLADLEAKLVDYITGLLDR